MDVIDVAILGAGGLTGRELLRLLQRHPYLRPVHITSDRYVGFPLEKVFPNLRGRDLLFQSNSAKTPRGLPVFLGTPNDVSLQKVPELFSDGNILVDLSGTFRLHNKKIWESVYNMEHVAFEYVEKFVYGLSEFLRKNIQKARAVSNPGCYASSAILPLLPILSSKEIVEEQILSIDVQSCSGVSGAGARVEGQVFSFSHVHENFRPYKILKHQHEPEIKEYASQCLNQDILFPLTFTPHLLPIECGILTTIVIHWKSEAPNHLEQALREFSEKEHFIRFYENPEDVELRKVQNTNYLDLAIRSRGEISVLVAALDNLIKGASGQAIQNMNLMLGIPEETGLL